jgi:protease-4
MPEFSKLLDTVGVRMEELRSGDMKAEPSPYKPMSEEVRSVTMAMVDDGFQWFMGLVAERRQLPMPRVRELSDGRVYTGRQALADKLIDELGGEDKAVAWLEADRSITPKLPVVDWKPARATDDFGLGFAALDMALGAIGLEGLRPAAERAQLDGLLALWHPAR